MLRQGRSPAISRYAAVFRRGGRISPPQRHGPHVRNAGSHESRALQVVAPGSFPWEAGLSFLRRLIDWLFPPQRDVSRLDTGLEDEAIDESVDLSGGPLKPQHRRRALRDRRLLPKRIQLGRRKRLLETATAERLFSLTGRTRNRSIRDLLPDEEQLGRYQLPVWKSDEEVANALGIGLKQLYFFSIHRYRDRFDHYVTFAIPKRAGGERLIMAPKSELKKLQRKLLKELVEKLPCSEHAHGFRAGRSVKTAAELHQGRTILFQLDLKDFFPSVTFARVRGLLISLGFGFPVATTLAVLMTTCPRQPVELDGQLYHVPVGERHCVQGAPTSPALCNAIALRLDRRLAGLARKLEFRYSRYADDLTFSGDHPDRLRNLARLATQIVTEEGFEVNRSKTRTRRRGGRQVVTGVVVNEKLTLPREVRRRLRAELHQLSLTDQPDPQRLEQARGRLAYLAMVNPEQAKSLRQRFPLP